MVDNPLIYLFSKTWSYSEGNRINIVLYWLMFIVACAVDLFCQPFLVAKIMNTVQANGITSANFRFLLGLLLLTLVVDVVFWSFHGPARCIERYNAFKVRLNYRKFLLKGVMNLPLEWHNEHHSGDIIDKVSKGTDALFKFSGNSYELIYSMVRLIVSYSILIYFSLPSAFIILGMFVLSCWIIMKFDKVIIKQHIEMNSFENQISESIFDAISNISTVVILRVERLIFGSIVHKTEKPFDLFKYNQRLNEFKWFSTNMCCTTMTILVIGVYFWQNIGTLQGVLIGSFYLLFRYLENISQLFFRFTDLYGEILQSKASMVNSEELSKDFKGENFTNHVLPVDWKILKVESLSFSYHSGGENLHLENVSFEARRGEKIAVVGERGSGKTTLLKIMRDLYHPQKLKLSVDGVIVPQGFGGISQAISLIPQSPEIFATTILQNITMGAEYEMDFIRRFTDMACFTDVVESLPRKFESSIKEKGVNLSGGQQQCLALSRGFLVSHNKDVVLLDEPTSSLDYSNGMKVYQNIFREFKGKTIVSSVHQVHLLPLFDRICVFEKGRIIASGTMLELFSSSREFRYVWDLMQMTAQGEVCLDQGRG